MAWDPEVPGSQEEVSSHPLLTLSYFVGIVVKERAYFWQDVDRHLNAATLEELVILTQ